MLHQYSLLGDSCDLRLQITASFLVSPQKAEPDFSRKAQCFQICVLFQPLCFRKCWRLGFCVTIYDVQKAGEFIALLKQGGSPLVFIFISASLAHYVNLFNPAVLALAILLLRAIPVSHHSWDLIFEQFD